MLERQSHSSMLGVGNIPAGNSIMLGLVLLLASGVTARSEEAAALDPVERQMVFVDRATEATELFNANQPTEALAAFEALAAQYPDLDEDGYVALSVGDCLAILSRDEEARVVYENAVAAHPDRADEIQQRLVELELAGDPTDALIEELRYAVRTRDESGLLANLRLGRALQKRANVLVHEAAACFRAAADPDWNPRGARTATVSRYASMLEELAEDLDALVQRAERRWNSARQPLSLSRCGEMPGPSPQIVTEQQRDHRIVRREDGKRFELEMRADSVEDGLHITANGKPVELTDTQKLLIQRHQERIAAILLEALEQTEQETPAQ